MPAAMTHLVCWTVAAKRRSFCGEVLCLGDVVGRKRVTSRSTSVGIGMLIRKLDLSRFEIAIKPLASSEPTQSHARTAAHRFLFGSASDSVVHGVPRAVEVVKTRPWRCTSEACRRGNSHAPIANDRGPFTYILGSSDEKDVQMRRPR